VTAAQSSIAARCAGRLRAPLADLRLAHKGWNAVWRAVDDDGARYAVKVGVGAGREGRMLRLLRDAGGLPIPTLFAEDDDLLIMDWLDGDAPHTAGGQTDCAARLAAAHAATAPTHGLDFATPIGPFEQDNTPNADWIAFFRDQRLAPQIAAAARENAITKDDTARYDRLLDKLDAFIEPPAQPSLLHGDLWGGNLFVAGDRLIGVIDPAVYYGHFEIELAFGGLFQTFDDVFLDRYAEIRGLDRAWRDNFLTLRRDIYNPYPLLVHARLFGRAYADRAAQIAARHVG